tara:strand:- start:581 stop:1204 length:624 start_codon:yes stop_codon:yes gene_type:complete
MAFISNGTTILDAGAFSASLGAMTFIKNVTVSGASDATILHGSSSVVFDSTYPIYVIKYINVMSSAGQNIAMNFTTDGTNYNVNITASPFVAEHSEDDSSVARLQYSGGYDQAEGTDQVVFNLNKGGLQNDSDASASGEIYIFNPSSTTFMKHFISRANSMSEYPGSTDNYCAGYANTTSAVTGVRFHAVSSNTISGTFLLYGIKDS